MRVKCLAQDHDTMSPARARTRAARSGDKRTNYKATVPPTKAGKGIINLSSLVKIYGKYSTWVLDVILCDF